MPSISSGTTSSGACGRDRRRHATQQAKPNAATRSPRSSAGGNPSCTAAPCRERLNGASSGRLPPASSGRTSLKNTARSGTVSTPTAVSTTPLVAAASSARPRPRRTRAITTGARVGLTAHTAPSRAPAAMSRRATSSAMTPASASRRTVSTLPWSSNPISGRLLARTSNAPGRTGDVARMPTKRSSSTVAAATAARPTSTTTTSAPRNGSRPSGAKSQPANGG
ncbi:hypothetical protein IN07_04300 [Modestobacter caceresii]|uniref:Uncharacterized protein n=1 Tax=Modestobacter caceresii TaxID=1522368 RepID=A0A098YB73_9ACTN|nr:hypothetical protein IN07_04300 [Modestobacter caceresii]